MEFDVEYYDELKRPMAMPEWADPDSLPQVWPYRKHRCSYTNTFLSEHGFSVGRNDTIEQLKQVLTATTPLLSDRCAGGLFIKEVWFSDELLADTETMMVYTVSKWEARSITQDKMCFRVVVGFQVRVESFRGPVLLRFTGVDPTTVLVADVKERLALELKTTVSSIYLMRSFPTLRTMACSAEHRLFGSPGVKVRGRWEQQPYPGPFGPATRPTPPSMKLSVVDEEAFRVIQAEEEWWSKLEAQPKWMGHAETLSGQKEPLRLHLARPRIPQWWSLNYPGVLDAVFCHSLLQTELYAETQQGDRVLLAWPDTSSLRGPCFFADETVVNEPPDGAHYLPTAAQIADEGSVYAKWDSSVAFGRAALETPAGVEQGAYRMSMSSAGKAVLYISTIIEDREGDEDGEDGVDGEGGGGGVEPEHIFECELTTGLSGCNVVRGTHWVQRSAKASATPEALRLPFCVFQLTSSDQVPDVVSSPMGQRFAGLKARSFAAIGPHANIIDSGPLLEPMSLDQLCAKLPSAPTVVSCLASLKHPDNPRAEPQAILILWRLNLNRLSSSVGLSEFDLEWLKRTHDVVVQGKSIADVTAQLAPQRVVQVGMRPVGRTASAAALAAAAAAKVKDQEQRANEQQQQQQQQQGVGGDGGQSPSAVKQRRVTDVLIEAGLVEDDELDEVFGIRASTILEEDADLPPSRGPSKRSARRASLTPAAKVPNGQQGQEEGAQETHQEQQATAKASQESLPQTMPPDEGGSGGAGDGGDGARGAGGGCCTVS